MTNRPNGPFPGPLGQYRGKWETKNNGSCGGTKIDDFGARDVRSGGYRRMRGRRSGGELPDLGRGERNRKREKSGMGRRKSLLIGLFLALAFGVTVYFRLWIIDYKISSDDAELIRRQFDIAHKEAVDESAEWRLRFDEERDKATKCMSKLDEIKGSGEKKSENVDANERMELLQKENIDLLQRLETLKQELDSLKLKCSSQ